MNAAESLQTSLPPWLLEPAGRWLLALGLVVFGLLAGWLAQRRLVARLRAVAKLTASPIDDLLIDAMRGLWPFAVGLLAVAAALRVAPLEPELRQSVIRFALSGFLAVAVLVSSRLVSGWLTLRAGESGAARPSLLRSTSRILIFGAGSLLVLDNLGFEITSLLTALGVGTLAVGLALQPTLSNFFAGLHLSMAKPVRVGDFIELEDGTQGHVVDIGWRATQLRHPANNLVIVPNARLAEMRLINYSLPESPQSVPVAVGVAYGCNLEQVEAVALEEARRLQSELPEADPGFEPVVRYTEFADSAINFNVFVRVRSFPDRFLVAHQLIKRLHRRFSAEGIEIPFPQRVFHRASPEAPS